MPQVLKSAILSLATVFSVAVQVWSQPSSAVESLLIGKWHYDTYDVTFRQDHSFLNEIAPGYPPPVHNPDAGTWHLAASNKLVKKYAQDGFEEWTIRSITSASLVIETAGVTQMLRRVGAFTARNVDELERQAKNELTRPEILSAKPSRESPAEKIASVCEDPVSQLLIGEWADTNGTVFHYNADHALTLRNPQYSSPTYNNEGSWRVEGDKIVHLLAGNESDVRQIVSITSDKLIDIAGEGSDSFTWELARLKPFDGDAALVEQAATEQLARVRANRANALAEKQRTDIAKKQQADATSAATIEKLLVGRWHIEASGNSSASSKIIGDEDVTYRNDHTFINRDYRGSGTWRIADGKTLVHDYRDQRIPEETFFVSSVDQSKLVLNGGQYYGVMNFSRVNSASTSVYDAVQSCIDEALKPVTTQYREAIAAFLRSAQTKGNLNEVLSADTELKRISTSSDVSIAWWQTPTAIERGDYVQPVANIFRRFERIARRTATEITSMAIALVESRERELTTRGKIDDAKFLAEQAQAMRQNIFGRGSSPEDRQFKKDISMPDFVVTERELLLPRADRHHPQHTIMGQIIAGDVLIVQAVQGSNLDVFDGSHGRYLVPIDETDFRERQRVRREWQAALSSRLAGLLHNPSTH